MSDRSSANRDIVPAERSLSQRILRETTRFAALQWFVVVVGWAAQVALARLLDRRDFGVFGICAFYIGLGQLLGDGGLGATLLRRKGEVTTEEYRTTITSLIAVALFFAGLLFVGAPWIAELSHLNESETTLLRAMAPLYLVGALCVVPYVRLEREFLFSVIARIELGAAIVRHSVAIVIAAIFGSVWALVGSQLMGAVVRLFLAYRASPGWVGFGWSWRVFRPLITYGSKVQGLSLLAYFKDNISRAMLGVWIGPIAVGIYDLGVTFIQIPVVAVNSLARVQLPVYARLEANDPALYAAFRAATRTAMLIGVPLLGMLALGAQWLIPAIFGSKWAAALPVVWGLLLNMVCGLVVSPLFTLLQAQGRAGLAMIVFGAWTGATWLLAIVGLLLFPGNLGVTAAAHSIATLAITAYLFVWASRHLKTNAAAGLGVPLLAGSAALLAAGLLEWNAVPSFGHPLAAAASSLAVYLLIVLTLQGRLVLAEGVAIWRGVRGGP